MPFLFFRFSELVGIHGKLDPLVHIDLTPEKRVKVTFTYGDLVEVSLRITEITTRAFDPVLTTTARKINKDRAQPVL